MNNLRYADDTQVIALVEGGLTRILDNVKTVSERYGLSLNASKANILILRQIKSYHIIYKYITTGNC